MAAFVGLSFYSRRIFTWIKRRRKGEKSIDEA
jgi:hypothetical protein